MELNLDELINARPRLKQYRPLYNEALEKGGIITWDDDHSHIDIILPDAINTDVFANSGIKEEDIVGLYIRPTEDKIITFLAVEDGSDVVPKNIIADKINSDATLNEITAKSVIQLNQCSLCHKDIPIEQQKTIHYQHYCPDCYAMLMKEQKQEQQLAGLYGEI